MTPAEIGGLVFGAAGLISGLSAWQKVRVESRSGAIVDVLKISARNEKEIERLQRDVDRERDRRRELEGRVEQMNIDCQEKLLAQVAIHAKEIERLTATTLRQAQEITALKERVSRADGDHK